MDTALTHSSQRLGLSCTVLLDGRNEQNADVAGELTKSLTPGRAVSSRFVDSQFASVMA